MVAVQVKVCGIRDPAGARACAAAGVDFAGLNFVQGSRRAVRTAQARELAPLLGATRPVGVFRDAAVDRIRSVADALGLRWVQLHGAETPATCRRLAADGLRVVKAVTAEQVGDAELMMAFAASARALLVDGREPGSGRVWRWETLAMSGRPGEIAGVPWWLAGGLGPGNVAEGIAALRPAGVDAASGVERGGRPDAARVADFCRAARSAGAGGSP